MLFAIVVRKSRGVNAVGLRELLNRDAPMGNGMESGSIKSGKRERFLIRRVAASRRDALISHNVDELIVDKGESLRNLPSLVGIDGPE